MSDFLKNIKSALDKGEFNSEIAKKITEINKLATDKINVEGYEKLLEKRNEKISFDKVSNEEIKQANEEYLKYHEKIKEEELELNFVSTLLNLERELNIIFTDIQNHIFDMETQFPSSKNQFFIDNINRIKKKYNINVASDELKNNDINKK